MSSDEITKILDALDRRLALGEIDLGTYNTLKAKFSGQANGSSQSPVEATVAAMPKEAVILRCPGCMAPMTPPPASQSNVIKCEYCGGSFALQTAQSEMEQLKSGIKKWISEIAGAAGAGGHVDEAARRFIFRDKLLPSLSMEANRSTEIFAFGRHQALFSFSLLDTLPNNPFQDALRSSPDIGSVVSRVKTTIARVQDPEVLGFAVGDSARSHLNVIETQCQEIIFLGNVRRALSENSAEGFAKAVANLNASEALYQKVAGASKAENASLAKFMEAMAARVRAVSGAIEILAQAMANSEGLVVDSLVAKLNSHASDCENSANLLESSGRDPREAVPAIEGARADAETLRLFATTLRAFAECAGDSSTTFTEFNANLAAIVQSVKPGGASIRWLAEFMTRFVQIGNTGSEDSRLAVIDRFDWLESRAQAGAQSSLFGGRESVQIRQRFLVPFWVARLRSSEQKGIIFKKGQSIEIFLMLNAGKPGGPCIRPDETVLKAEDIKASLSNRRSLNSHTALVPVIDRDTANKRFKEFVQSTPEFAGGFAEIQELVFLPAGQIAYSGKKGERTELECILPASLKGMLDLEKKSIGRWKISFAR